MDLDNIIPTPTWVAELLGSGYTVLTGALTVMSQLRDRKVKRFLRGLNARLKLLEHETITNDAFLNLLLQTLPTVVREHRDYKEGIFHAILVDAAGTITENTSIHGLFIEVTAAIEPRHIAMLKQLEIAATKGGHGGLSFNELYRQMNLGPDDDPIRDSLAIASVSRLLNYGLVQTASIPGMPLDTVTPDGAIRLAHCLLSPLGKRYVKHIRNFPEPETE